MKKLISIFLVMTMVLALTACSKGSSEPAQETAAEDSVEIDYGKSETYSQEDMDAAIGMIKEEFGTWEGCELHSIRYAGDECITDENIAWMNELGEGKDYKQVIEFTSDFHSPKEGGGAWEADTEYTGWQWWLAREEGGSWDLLTFGY